MVARARYVGIVALAVTGLAVGAAWWVLAEPGSGRGWILGFVVAMAVGELIAVDEPDSRPVPASIAVLGAFVLLGNDPLTSVAVALAGVAAGGAICAVAGTGSFRPGDALARIIAAWSLPTLVAVADRLPSTFEIVPAGGADEPFNLVAFLLVSAAIVLGLPFWEAVEAGSPQGTVVGALYGARLRATWLAGVALVAGAGLAALVHADLNSWGLVLTLLPLLAARSGLRRLASVRRTHAQTVRAMSRIAEFVDAAPEGHAARVAAVVVSMGRDLGLSATDIADLERAALLHEIGVVVAEGDLVDAARASAEVVREVPHLAKVATIIDRHRETRRLGIVVGEDRLPLPSRILRTACEFDRLIAPTQLDHGSRDAIHHFHVTAGHEHEPVLIQALARTVDRGLLI